MGRHDRLRPGDLAAAASPVLGLGHSLPLLAVAAAVAGAGQGACRPAFQALTAEVVDEARRQQANAALTLAVRVTVLVGPASTALLATVVDTSALLCGRLRSGASGPITTLVPVPGP